MNLFQMPRYFQGLLLPGFLLGSATISHAQTMVARDTNNPYQKSPHHKLRHVLLYDRGFDYTNSRRLFRNSMARLAVKYGFRLDTSAATGYVTPRTLSGVDVLALGPSSGDKFGQPVSDSVVERFVYAQGKSVWLVYAAAAFISCPGTGNGGAGDRLSDPACRFLARAAARQYFRYNSGRFTVYADSVRLGEIPPHASMGGDTTNPPASQMDHGVANAETRNIFAGLPRTWEGIQDGYWFNFTSSPRIVGATPRKIASLDSASHTEGRVNILLSLDESRNDFGLNKMGDHPIAWTRKMGNGVSAVMGFGHTDVYTEPRVVAGDSIRDSVVEKFNGRLLRYLARDFVGCMNPSSPHYNPEATVARLTEIDPVDPCAGPASIRSSGRGVSGPRVSGRAGAIRVSWEQPGRRDVRIVDVAGKTVFFRAGYESNVLEVPSLQSGIYFVKVAAPEGSKTAQRVNLF